MDCRVNIHLYISLYSVSFSGPELPLLGWSFPYLSTYLQISWCPCVSLFWHASNPAHILSDSMWPTGGGLSEAIRSTSEMTPLLWLESVLADSCDYPELLAGGLCLCPQALHMAGVAPHSIMMWRQQDFLDAHALLRHTVKDARLSVDTGEDQICLISSTPQWPKQITGQHWFSEGGTLEHRESITIRVQDFKQMSSRQEN